MGSRSNTDADAFIELPSIIGNTILAQPLLVAFFPIACRKLASVFQVAAFATCSRKIPGGNTEALKVLSLTDAYAFIVLSSFIGNTILAYPLLVACLPLFLRKATFCFQLVAFTA